jgi:hypothetical protein
MFETTFYFQAVILWVFPVACGLGPSDVISSTENGLPFLPRMSYKATKGPIVLTPKIESPVTSAVILIAKEEYPRYLCYPFRDKACIHVTN